MIILDIASDRRGVYEIGPSQRVSFTGELGRSKVLDRYPDRRFVRFGTDEHYELFRISAREIKDLLVECAAFSRTRVLKFDFTDRSTNGVAIPKVLGTSGSTWNVLYSRYYEELIRLGFTVLTLPSAYSISTITHQWGIGQDHFMDEAYFWLRDSLLQSLP